MSAAEAFPEVTPEAAAGAAARLDDYLADTAAPDQTQQYRIGGINEADWAARKLARSEARMAEVRAAAAAQRRRINEWEEAELARLAPDASFFRSMLTDWWRREMDAALLEAGGVWDKVRRPKSQHLPGGGRVVAHASSKVEVVDADLLMAWAKEHRPDLITTKTVESVPVATLRAALKPAAPTPDPLNPWGELSDLVDPATGERVPGVYVCKTIGFDADGQP